MLCYIIALLLLGGGAEGSNERLVRVQPNYLCLQYLSYHRCSHSLIVTDRHYKTCYRFVAIIMYVLIRQLLV